MPMHLYRHLAHMTPIAEIARLQGLMVDGGMVVADDTALAEKSRLTREYSWARRYVRHIRGWNSRLDELQAAVLGVK